MEKNNNESTKMLSLKILAFVMVDVLECIV